MPNKIIQIYDIYFQFGGDCVSWISLLVYFCYGYASARQGNVEVACLVIILLGYLLEGIITRQLIDEQRIRISLLEKPRGFR